MKRLSVGDLATFSYLEDLAYADMYKYKGSIVEIIEILPDFERWDYTAKFLDGKVFEVAEEELEPIFTR